MLSIQLKNFRSFGDTGIIDIRPITIFVGKNGSGKSSITRFLPLLRQSVEMRGSAPLVWYGTYVDFGSIREVASKTSTSQGISITLTLSELQSALQHRSGRYRTPRYRRSILSSAKSLSYTANLERSDTITSIESFLLKIDGDIIYFKIDENRAIKKVTFNDIDLTDTLARDSLRFSSSHLIPFPMFTSVPEAETSVTALDFGMKAIYERLLRTYKYQLHGNVQNRSVHNIIRFNHYAPRNQFLKQLEKFDSGMHSWANLVSHLQRDESKQDLDLLRGLHFFVDFQDHIWELEGTFRRNFAGITYLGPARATSERYYRLQELAVDQIDPQGENFAMFLSSLSPSRVENFSSWVAKYLGHEIRIERLTGHVSVLLKELHSSHEYNLADMGYGFSQILPILAQVWMQRYLGGGDDDEAPIIALEQPELHLHPALQSSLADAFSSVIYRMSGANSWEKTGLNLVVETHSEALISRLGDLVANGSINAKDIAIYVFERTIDDECTEVRKASFDDQGRLKNWPFGFFSRSGASKSYDNRAIG